MSLDALDPAFLDARRVLVVAPHPDDESLGCGGLISLLGGAGAAVHTVFVTDGGASHPNSRDWPRQRLAEQREREAIEALARLGLGIHPRTFLRLRDADMPKHGSPDHERAAAAMTAIAGTLQPDLVLVPWRRDPHCDHRDAWQLTMAAVSSLAPRPTMLEYAIWLDELGAPDDRPRPGEAERIAFDIAPAAGAKRSAVDAHLSQTTDLIADDPAGFRLKPETIERLTGPAEYYWRARP